MRKRIDYYIRKKKDMIFLQFLLHCNKEMMVKCMGTFCLYLYWYMMMADYFLNHYKYYCYYYFRVNSKPVNTTPLSWKKKMNGNYIFFPRDYYYNPHLLLHYYKMISAIPIPQKMRGFSGKGAPKEVPVIRMMSIREGGGTRV